MTYRIRTVAELTGIPRNTLIAWERRYGFINPERHENGYRSYSEDDVERLRRVQNAMHAGLKISEAVALLEHEEANQSQDTSQSHPKPGQGQALSVVATEGYERVASRLTEALVNYRREEADQILGELMPIPFGTRLHKVFFPTLRQIGQKWEDGEVSIAQEHYASAILRTHMAGVLVGIGTRGKTALHAACTTFTGDMHELAALALAIQLSLDGNRVSYLGPNLPSEEVVDFSLKQKVQLLCVSVIKTPNEAEFRRYLKAMPPLVQAGVRVVIGGQQLAGMKLNPPDGVEILYNWEDFDFNQKQPPTV